MSLDKDVALHASRVWRRRGSLTRRRSLLLDTIVGDDILQEPLDPPSEHPEVGRPATASPQRRGTQPTIHVAFGRTSGAKATPPRPHTTQALRRRQSMKGLAGSSSAHGLKKIPPSPLRGSAKKLGRVKSAGTLRRKASSHRTSPVLRSSRSKGDDGPVKAYTRPGLVFPEYLQKRGDFQSLLQADINAVHGRRTSAAHFLKFQVGIDTEISEKHFQGPGRSRNLRRHAILDVSRSQRATEPPVHIRPVAAMDIDEGLKEEGDAKMPWESEKDDDALLEASRTAREKKQFSAPMRSDMDFAQAERYLQRAFVVRARTFGLKEESTVQARTNLLKCYIAQNKMDDIKQIRDNVKAHLASLERGLADFETDLRRSKLRQKMRKHARALGAESLAAARQKSDTLEVGSRRRVKDRLEVAMPARFQGNFRDSRLLEYHHLKAAPSPSTSATMMFPQHQAGARRAEQKKKLMNSAQAELKAGSPSPPRGRAGAAAGGRRGAAGGSPARSPTRGGAAAQGQAGEVRSGPATPGSPQKRLVAPTPEIVRPHKVGGLPPPAALASSAAGSTVLASSKTFRADAKEQLQLSNFVRAADSCRQGLTVDSGDAALRAMFRASLGKLAEYPRRDDFNADLRLWTTADAILGERLVVKYKYQHRTMPKRRHTTLDWVGLFKVLDAQDSFQPDPEHLKGGVSALTPGSGAGAGRGFGGKEEGAGEEDAAKTRPRTDSEGGRTGRSAMSASEKRAFLYELAQKEEARKRRKQEERARIEAAKAAEDPLEALLDGTLNFGDSEVTADHKEVLVGWSLVPPANEGSVVFNGLPTEAGHYRIRYFVHGSQCPIGKAEDVFARLVDIDLDVSSRVFCGDRLTVKYKMHYREARHGPNDWAGLYCIPPPGPTPDVEWTPYVYTQAIEIAKLPPDNEGVVEFKDHPVYPGLYEVRVFTHQDVDSLVGVTRPIVAELPFNDFAKFGSLRRELRIYLSAPFTCSDEERTALAKVVMPHIRTVCEERCVTPVLVDLRSQLAHYGGRPVKLGEKLESFLQEIEDCRPNVLMTMGQGYGWVANEFSSAVSHLFPWVRHHNNPALPKQEEMQRKKGSLLGAMRGMMKVEGQDVKDGVAKVLDGRETDLHVHDAEHPVPVHASMMELEMVSALRLPELQVSGGELTAHCHIYTRHPSMHTTQLHLPSIKHIADFQPPARTCERALAHWRNVCAKRGWRCRNGYQNMNTLADWIITDLMAAIDENFPKRKLPPPSLLWTMSSMSHAATRKAFAVISDARIAMMDQLTAYATSKSAPNRPLGVVGKHGSGKSSLLAVWSALLYHQSRPNAPGMTSHIVRAARKVDMVNKLYHAHDALQSGGKSSAKPKEGRPSLDISLLSQLRPATPRSTLEGCLYRKLGEPRDTVPVSSQASSESKVKAEAARAQAAREAVDPDRNAIYEALPTCPTYFTMKLKTSTFIAVVIHIGENGTPNTAPELMRCITQALAQLSRCEHEAEEVAQAVAHNKGFSAVRQAFMNCIEHALLSSRILLVLDGLNKMTDCARERAVHGADDDAGNGSGKGDGDHGPPALWWFPQEIPLGLHLIYSIAPVALGWGAVQARGWARERIELPSLSVPEATEVMERALSRGGVGNEWSHNHGTRFRYWLDLPVSTVNMRILTEAAEEEARELGVRVVPVQEHVGQSLRKVLQYWFTAHELCRNPLWLRVAIARLCMTKNVAAALAVARLVVTETLPQMLKHLLRDCRYKIALQALKLLLVCHRGLQECELVDLLGGAQFRRRERRGSDAYHAGSAGASSALAAPFFSSSAEARSRQLGVQFEAVNWSQARRWLLSTFVSRGRGLWNIDHQLVRKVTEAHVFTDASSRVPWMQRLAAYFWTQPSGLRKAEELPILLLQLHALAVKKAAEKPAETEERGKGRSGGVSRPSVTRVAPRRRRRSSIGAMMQMLGSNRRPSSLIVGMTTMQAFPLDVRRCQERILQCLRDITLLSEMERSGGELRDLLFHGIKASGKTPTQVMDLVRLSFEQFHGITGFTKSPHYQLARTALIDPEYEKHKDEERQREQEREAKRKLSKKRQVWAPTRKTDTTNWVRVTAEQWDRLRHVGCSQMMHVGFVAEELCSLNHAYTSVETALLLNFGQRTWEMLVATLKAEAYANDMNDHVTEAANEGVRITAASLCSKKVAARSLLLASRILLKRLQFLSARQGNKAAADSPPRLRNKAPPQQINITDMTLAQVLNRLKGVRFVVAGLERMTAPTIDTRNAIENYNKALEVLGHKKKRSASQVLAGHIKSAIRAKRAKVRFLHSGKKKHRSRSPKKH